MNSSRGGVSVQWSLPPKNSKGTQVTGYVVQVVYLKHGIDGAQNHLFGPAVSMATFFHWPTVAFTMNMVAKMDSTDAVSLGSITVGANGIVAEMFVV
jgi:hypothetical protein